MSTRKSISVKRDVHERYRKRAAQLSTKERRVTIAELVEIASKHLGEIALVEGFVQAKEAQH